MRLLVTLFMMLFLSVNCRAQDVGVLVDALALAGC
jgi:hypothetical protein